MRYANAPDYEPQKKDKISKGWFVYVVEDISKMYLYGSVEGFDGTARLLATECRLIRTADGRVWDNPATKPQGLTDGEMHAIANKLIESGKLPSYWITPFVWGAQYYRNHYAQPSGWVRTQDKLPELFVKPQREENFYLLFDGCLTTIGLYRGGGVWNTLNDLFQSPTHWKPLPAPPEGV